MSLETIKELREKTGAGMVDCQKALKEAEGDMEKAIDILRKKGIAKAAKRGDRETNEGVVKVGVNDDGTEGYLVEVNAETDFVALNTKFQDFADKVLELIKVNKPKDNDELNALSMGDLSVKDTLDNLSGVIGEKLGIKRFAVLTGATVAAYSHMGGRIGVLVSLNKSGEKEKAIDIAMQIAATNPRYIDPSEVPAEEMDREKEIYREQLLKEGKPENMIEKIMEGKMAKYYEEVCLVKQEFIKDDKKKVEQYLGDVKVEKFIRYSL
jgi:elongation factor Ts